MFIFCFIDNKTHKNQYCLIKKQKNQIFIYIRILTYNESYTWFLSYIQSQLVQVVLFLCSPGSVHNKKFLNIRRARNRVILVLSGYCFKTVSFVLCRCFTDRWSVCQRPYDPFKEDKGPPSIFKGARANIKKFFFKNKPLEMNNRVLSGRGLYRVHRRVFLHCGGGGRSLVKFAQQLYIMYTTTTYKRAGTLECLYV